MIAQLPLPAKTPSNRSRKKRRHGLAYVPEYRVWQTMRLRCLEPTNKAYPSYGGRGITICDRWKDSPQNFIADMGPKPSRSHEIDRIDNDKGYEPGNCRWTTRSINDRNRRNNRWIKCDGQRRTLIEWSELSGVGQDTIAKRLQAGWDPYKAIHTPARPKRPNRSAWRAA